MSFFKKVGRRLGVNRKGRNEASADANVPLPLQQGISALSEINARGTHDTIPPTAIADVRSQITSQSSQQDIKHVGREGNPISISGGTFTNVGRDLIHNHYVTEDSKDTKLFELLNPVPAAHDCEVVSSKVSECFVGTRQQLLHDIETWRTTGSVPIFILDGIAGIGKSTIVKTVCAQADAQQCLAASWFFSRDEQDRKTTRGFVRTLAFQLASYHPVLRERISQVLKAQPDILQKTIRMQFEALIQGPLRDVFGNQSKTHTISIDAIDECNLTEAVELLSTLLTSIPQHPKLRLLVTCRPERPFRLLLQKHRGPRIFHLHEIENSVVETDIRLYIDHCLSPAQIDEALPDLLPPLWRASAEEKEALVQMAGKLFIVASTAINFILDPLRLAPAEQMAQLLDVKAGAGLASSSMDHLYVQILRAAVPERVRDWFEDYQTVVGSIVVAADVLSVQSLASLLEMEPNRIVRTLSHLHSLIAPTRDSDAFHIHHKSFPDFVTDKSRCALDSRFFIEASSRHFHLAHHCLRIMTQMLKQNICELPRSDWSIESRNLPPGTKDQIPPELAYACAYWIFHIREGLPHIVGLHDITNQLVSFVDQHLLSWLEVLAWTNRFDTAWGDVSLLSESIAQLLRNTGGETINPSLSHVVDVLRDLLRFISLHPEIPRHFPMHIYLSALPFAPNESKIRHLYANSALNTTQSVNVVSGLEQRWNPISATFEESLYIMDMDLSPCGTMVASCSGHDVHLYNAKSGQLLQSPGSKKEGYWVDSIAFSPDSQRLATTSPDGIRVWDVLSGELFGSCPVSPSTPLFDTSSPVVRIYSEHEFYDIWNPNTLRAASLIFNPDGSSIITGTADGRVLLWHIGELKAVLLPADRSLNHPCECLPEETRVVCGVHSVTILITLPDSPALAGVTQSAVHFWDQITHKYLKGIPRCVTDSYANPVSVSSDKKMMAIDCDPCVISIHLTRTQNRLCDLSGHQGRITTTAFAPPSPSRQQQLCSASDDRTVRLWDITTASQLANIQTVFVFTDTLFSVELDTFVLADRAERGRMVRLAEDQCIAYGPSRFRGGMSKGLKISVDGSTLASFQGNSIMVANACDFVDPAVHTGTHELSQLFRFGYAASGEVVAVYRVDELESPLEFSEGATSLNVTIRAILIQPSPDLSRLAIIEDDSATTLWIYNLCSRKQEAGLPLPPLDPENDSRRESFRVQFSWDSSTVYLEPLDGKIYVARLPSFTTSRDNVSCSQPTFSEISDAPIPHAKCLEATGLPHASQLNFLAEDRAWVLLNDEKTWTQIPLPSLPFEDMYGIAYSPSGVLIAIAIYRRTEEGYAEGINIQVRRLPDYDLVETLVDHHHGNFIRDLRFIKHLPHILMVSSYIGFTCWDATTRQSLGNSYSLSHFDSLESVHPYNGSDFLCLMRSRSALLVLVAIQLRGPDLPEVAQQLCFFPLHLSVPPIIRVNPCRPHIVALSTRNRIIQIDISKCPLPFTL